MCSSDLTEWKRGTRQTGLSMFSAAPAVNLRPTVAGIDILVRYVTRASQRFEMRNHLYQRVIDLRHEPENATADTGQDQTSLPLAPQLNAK